MSAIAGVWSFDGAVGAVSSCQAMLEALSVYGRDDRALFRSAAMSMGRCLLRSLPEDQFDRQPLAAPSVTSLVADLRLDNRDELAAELGISKSEATTMADCALLLAAWLRWGEECVDRLCGAFSFAVWNAGEQHLFLARDHTGERPLFYASAANCFAFASMPKGLHALPFVGAEVDEEYVARYVTLSNTPIEQTIFRNIRRLPAGCSLSIRREQTKLSRHWRTDQLPNLHLRSAGDYLDYFRETFDAAVGARLRTVGGVGAQLSGGLDSGAVSATAAGLLRAGGRELSCFTAVPRRDFVAPVSDTHFFDEGGPAADVAALYSNIHHVLVESSGRSFLDILDHNNHLYDHPCYGPSNEVWGNAILDQARAKGITVVLHGNCGNSTISYDGMSAFSTWFRSGQWGTIARVALQLREKGFVSMRSLVRNGVWPSLPGWLRRATDPHMHGFSLNYSMLHPAVVKRFDLERVAFQDSVQNSASGRTMLRNLLEFGDVGDSAMMAQGGWQLDLRDPTYDRRVVEFCLTAPPEEFVRDGVPRSLVRRAMAERLPATTLQRNKRGLQSADWYLNLGSVRGRMADEVKVLQASPLVSRMLDLSRMQSLITNWPSGGFDTHEVMRAYHMALTRGFSVGKFLMKYDPDLRG